MGRDVRIRLPLTAYRHRMAAQLLEGLRADGRRPPEIRTVRCKLGIFEKADGSAYLQQGNTRCTVSIYGPREVTRRADAKHDRCIVTCEYSVATFSAGERKRKSRGDRRSTEAAMLVCNTFEDVIMTHLFARSQIAIYIQILQSDGGALSAAINATTLALIDAGIPIKDFVVGCSCSCIDGVPIVDTNHLEDMLGGVNMTVAMLVKSGKIITMQTDSILPLDSLKPTLELGVEGCRKTHELLLSEVRENTVHLLEARSQ